jgi:hypothetical protein
VIVNIWKKIKNSQKIKTLKKSFHWISLEPGWVCPLALIRRAPDFLEKSFLDPQHVISPLNFAR